MYLKHGIAVVWHDNKFASSSSISQSAEATLSLLTLLSIPKDIHSNTCRRTLLRMETWLSFLPYLPHLLALFPVLAQNWSYATTLVGQLGCYYVLKIATIQQIFLIHFSLYFCSVPPLFLLTLSLRILCFSLMYSFQEPPLWFPACLWYWQLAVSFLFQVLFSSKCFWKHVFSCLVLLKCPVTWQEKTVARG